MANPQQELNFSPMAAHKVLFRHTTHETKGDLLQMEVFLSPKSSGPPMHYHLVQEERIEVIKGELMCTIAGEQHILKAGESITIEPGEDHHIKNVSGQPAYFLNELRPALDFEYFIEELQQCVTENGVRNFYSPAGALHFMVIFHKYKKEMQLSGKWRQALGGFLAWLGTSFGMGKGR